MRSLLVVLVATTWAAALFETDLQLFRDLAGVSLFVFSGGALLLLMLVLWLSGSLDASGLHRYLRAHQLLFLAYACYWVLAWIGAAYSSDAGTAAFVVVQYAWYTLLALASIAALHQVGPASRRRALAAAGAITVVVLLYLSLHAVVTGDIINRIVAERGRFRFGVFRDYNMFTLALLMGTLMAMLWDGLGRLPRWRWSVPLYVLLILISLGAGVLAGSRRSIVAYGPLALLVPAVILGFRSTAMLRGAAWRVVVSTFVLAGLLATLMPSPAARPTLERELQTGMESSVRRAAGFVTGEYQDVSSRTQRWKAAWDMVEDYPVFAQLIGAGTRSYYARAVFTRPDGGRDTPHNFVLAALLEGGVLRLAVVMVFLVSWLAVLWRQSADMGYWLANALFSGTFLWLVNVSISGEEFFNSRHLLLLFVAHGSLWPFAAERSGVRLAGSPDVG